MAYKAKFLHFKTKQSYNAERNKTNEGTDERKIFDAYISFVDEGPTIYTWGKEYKCELSLTEVESLIDSKGFITIEDIPDVPEAGTLTPKVADTAVVGTSTKYAREDHVHPAQTTITGNAGTATKLQTARTITLSGDVTGSTNFDGSNDVTVTTTVANDSHSHTNATITSIDASKITSGVIDIERLPKGALERLVIVANQSERYALTADDVQEGDTVKQEDTGVMYFVVDIDNLANENGYKVYTAGSATSVPWSGVTGKPDLVNSVKLVLPSSIFINSGSTLTGNAELGSSLSTQNANTVWAAPSGTSGVPTFRKLTFLDMNTVTSNEFNYIPQTFKGGALFINYRSKSSGQNVNNIITDYIFKDGATGNAYVIAKGFKTSENNGHRVLCSDGSLKDLETKQLVVNGTINNFYSSDSVEVRLYAPTSGGTSGQILVSNGNNAPNWASLDSLGYLPLTGGKISGSLRIDGNITPVSHRVSNIGESGKKFKNIYAATLHGNFNESTTFAAPHPNPIYIDNTNNSTDGVYLVLKNKGVYVSSFGTTNETTSHIETFMLHRKSDQSNSYKLSIRDDGNAYIQGKIIATQEWVTNNISGLSTNISSQGSVIASLGQYLITGADANATTTASTVKIKLNQIGRSTATSASAFGSPSLESSGVTIHAATTTTAGVMTATDKSNLNTAYGWGNHASAGYLKSIPTASSSSYGGIKIGYSATDKNYAVQLDSNGKAYVNVPWTDTNTNYYPTTFTWTNGTSKGPTGSLTGTGMSAVSFGAIPAASTSNSGVITTEDQEISGVKYFNNGVFVGSKDDVSIGIIDAHEFGYNGLGIVSDTNVYIAPDNNIVYFGYDEDIYIQNGEFSGNAATASQVKNALTINVGTSSIEYNGSKTEQITIPRDRQTNLTMRAYGSDSSITVKKGICYFHKTDLLGATSITLSLDTSDWSRVLSVNNKETIETAVVVVESTCPVTFSSNSMLKVQKDIPLNGDAETYRVYVFSRIAPTLVAVNCAVYKAS